MTITALPDAEATVATWLRSVSEVAAIVGGRIYTYIPEQPTWPLMRVARTGGQPVDIDADRVQVQIDCWADARSQELASDAARAIVAAVKEAEFDGPQPDGGYVTCSYIPLGPVWSPDRETGNPRYIVTLDFELWSWEG
jgi:hypothetical protein